MEREELRMAREERDHLRDVLERLLTADKASVGGRAQMRDALLSLRPGDVSRAALHWAGSDAKALASEMGL